MKQMIYIIEKISKDFSWPPFSRFINRHSNTFAENNFHLSRLRNQHVDFHNEVNQCIGRRDLISTKEINNEILQKRNSRIYRAVDS